MLRFILHSLPFHFGVAPNLPLLHPLLDVAVGDALKRRRRATAVGVEEGVNLFENSVVDVHSVVEMIHHVLPTAASRAGRVRRGEGRGRVSEWCVLFCGFATC